jgi:Xaa-Pro dipeptidase
VTKEELWTPRPFADAEYVTRQQNVRAACAERGLDGLLLFAQESLYYLFGYDQLGYWVYQTFVFPAAGDGAIAIARAPDELIIRQSPWVDDVRVWFDESAEGPGEITCGALADVGLLQPGTRLGIELESHSLLPRYYQELKDALPAGFELLDASDLVAGLRMVKSEAEVAYFRTAAQYLRGAFDAVLPELVPGVRESDLHAAVTSALYRQGADAPAIPPPIASGPRTLGQAHLSANARQIAAGDPIMIEIGAVAARYHAVGVQTFVMGEPAEPLKHLHTSIVEALESGFEHIGPGRPVATVARTVQASLQNAGLSRAGRHVGYGTGIGYPPNWLEDWRVKITEEREFAPGMTFFYFVGIPDVDRGYCVYLGEPILVTKDGYERVAPPDYSAWSE